jgi:hypothetical protein
VNGVAAHCAAVCAVVCVQPQLWCLAPAAHTHIHILLFARCIGCWGSLLGALLLQALMLRLLLGCAHKEHARHARVCMLLCCVPGSADLHRTCVQGACWAGIAVGAGEGWCVLCFEPLRTVCGGQVSVCGRFGSALSPVWRSAASVDAHRGCGCHFVHWGIGLREC